MNSVVDAARLLQMEVAAGQASAVTSPSDGDSSA